MSLLWFTASHSYQCMLSNYIQNARIWVPSQYAKQDAVLQGETSIADGVLQNLSYMYERDGVSFWWHKEAPFVPASFISTKVSSQIAHKITGFGYPPIAGNRIPCYEERHPLLLKCFKTSLKRKWKMQISSDSIYERLTVHNLPFPTIIGSYIT